MTSTDEQATATGTRVNPWTLALVVLYCVVLAIGLMLAAAARGGEDGSEPDLVFALGGLSLISGGIVLIGLHLAVRSVRWYLDPSSRAVLPPPAERLPRQDF